MRIRCNRCGRPVSSELPETTVIQGWVECPECLMRETGPPVPHPEDMVLFLRTREDKTRDVDA